MRKEYLRIASGVHALQGTAAGAQQPWDAPHVARQSLARPARGYIGDLIFTK